MSRLGILSNTNSGGNRKGLDRVVAAARALELPHVLTRDVQEIEPALRQLAASGTRILVVNGGDGTIQAVLSALRRQPIFAEEPILAVLPGGTTNMIHRDVGARGESSLVLRRLAHAGSNRTPGGTVVRPVIELQSEDRGAPRYGFFFGAAALPRVICASRKALHPRGFSGPAGESLALAWTLWRLLAGRAARDPVLHPDSIGFALDGDAWQRKHFVFLLVTTLDRLLLGLRPVAPRGQLGVVGLTWPYRRLWRALPGLVAGRNLTSPRDGVMRFVGRQIALRTAATCMFDGELFAVDSALPLRLTTAAPARFLRV